MIKLKESETNYFQKLYDIDLSHKAAEKNGLTYLPWAAVWAEVKKVYPNATFEIYENEMGRPWFDDGHSAWVKTGVTICGVEHIEYLPIMNYKNQAIEASAVTSTDANKSIQRSITKACARHGIGLFVYEGEDIPEAVSKINEANEANYELACVISKMSTAKKNEIRGIVEKYTETGNPRDVENLEDAKQLHIELIKLKNRKDV